VAEVNIQQKEKKQQIFCINSVQFYRFGSIAILVTAYLSETNYTFKFRRYLTETHCG